MSRAAGATRARKDVTPPPPRAPSGYGVEDRLLPIGAVKEIAGIGKTMIYRLERAGRFPKRYKPGGAASRWSEREVVAWREEQRSA